MKKNHTDSILITSYDLKRLFFRTWPQIKRHALLLFCLSCVFLLVQKPEYLAKASFKHLDKQNDLSPFAKEFFRDLSISTNTTPIYSVMHSSRVLKGAIEQLGMQIIQDSPVNLLTRIIDNIKAECGKKPREPDSFRFQNVSFEGEDSIRLYINPLSSTHFEVFDAEKQLVAKGELGKLLHLPNASFVLNAYSRSVAYNTFYSFKIIPWISALEQTRKKFEVRAHKLDKNVFLLYFKHSDRNIASQFLNLAMHSYQEYYRKENEEICETQVAYLEKRQDELIAQFDAALAEHVHYLKNNIAESGCMGVSNELDILAAPQNLFNSKLFDVDLELKRLESLYANTLLASELETKQNLPAVSLKSSLEQSRHDRDLEEKRRLLQNIESKNEKLDCDALTLSSAKALYQQYTEKKDASEASLRERIFLRDRLNDPEFELSSLSTFLTDPVSVSLTQHASNIALKIKDGENRTPREQERLKEELDTQKRFLHQHLTHMIELEKLKANLLSHKIHSLQMQTLNLLDEEKHLLKEKIHELNQKMGSLPEKWHRENLLLLKKELGSRIIESMTQLIETKNLNQKLYQVSSKHLDLSVTPFNACSPHIILYSLCLTFLGCFLTYLFQLCRLILNGFPVSHENLKMLGLDSCGRLTEHSGKTLEQLKDIDLSTLRNIVHFISSLRPNSIVALIHGKQPDFSASLAALLDFAGKKTLILPYTELLSCDVPRFAVDMLPACSGHLCDLKQKYDYVILKSDASLKEAQGFCRIADAAILATFEESQEDIYPYRSWVEEHETFRLAFVCYD